MPQYDLPLDLLEQYAPEIAEPAGFAEFWRDTIAEARAVATEPRLERVDAGFGLDLGECAVTGSALDLAFVSPRSGRAVSRAGAGDYAERLFPLPSFLLASGGAEWPDIFHGPAITGHFLGRDILIDRYADLLAARGRLVDRLKRVTGS